MAQRHDMDITKEEVHEQAQLELQSRLLPGESILWRGKPSRKIIFHSDDRITIPFSFLWGGFGGFLAYQNLRSAAETDAVSDLLVLWALIFVLMGQYLIWGRFLYSAWKKKNTLYAVTNMRVLNLRYDWTYKLIEGLLANLYSVKISPRRNGYGTIKFYPQPKRKISWFSANHRNNVVTDIDHDSLTFHDIPNMQEVYQLIQAQQTRMSSHPSQQAQS